MSTEGNYEAALRQLAESTASPEAHREQMWDAVSRSWSARAARRARLRSLTRWTGAGVGLAAALVIGIFIGRSGGDGLGPALTDDGARPERAATTRLPTPYRIAIGEHLRDAEMLLSSFGAADEVDAELVRSARELAAATRLLIGSRAGDDPDARRLLLDVELLLIQISRLVDPGDATERDVVREGLAESTVLPRLQDGTWLQGV
jgi:hypothetical protein